MVIFLYVYGPLRFFSPAKFTFVSVFFFLGGRLFYLFWFEGVLYSLYTTFFFPTYIFCKYLFPFISMSFYSLYVVLSWIGVHFDLVLYVISFLYFDLSYLFHKDTLFYCRVIFFLFCFWYLSLIPIGFEFCMSK